MLQISQNVYIYLCYLSNTSHFHACDTCLGFLVGAVGMSPHLFLHHLRGAFVSPQIGDSFRMLPKSVVIGVQKEDNVCKYLEPQVTYYCDHHVTWHVLSWNHEESPRVENVCFSTVECGGVHTPSCDPSLSIHLLMLGQQ
jgi:hypothetical protein